MTRDEILNEAVSSLGSVQDWGEGWHQGDDYTDTWEQSY
jgi:hypothetical protein